MRAQRPAPIKIVPQAPSPLRPVQTTPLELSSIRTSPQWNSRLTEKEDCFLLESNRHQWNYAAEILLPEPIKRRQWLQLHLKTVRGQMGCYLEDEGLYIGQEVLAPVSKTVEKFVLFLPEGTERVFLRNTAEEGGSCAEIHQLRLLSQEEIKLPASIQNKWESRTTPEDTPLLTPEHLRRYWKDGFVRQVPCFETDEVEWMQTLYQELKAHLGAPELFYLLTMWHRYNEALARLARHEKILDAVEMLLGPNLAIWDATFYVKGCQDPAVIPWHQDGANWEPALEPINAVTVIIPFVDCLKSNACMQVIPGSHLKDEWYRSVYPTDPMHILEQEIPETEFPLDVIEHTEIKAGDIMFHHPGLIHSSPGNFSDRERICFTIRYTSTAVTCDYDRWPDFAMLPVRGRLLQPDQQLCAMPEGWGVPDLFGYWTQALPEPVEHRRPIRDIDTLHPPFPV